MNSRVDEIYEQIKALEAELEQIREQCQHPSYKVEMYSWRIGAMHPARICTSCHKVLSGITADEQSQCWNTSGFKF